MNLDVFDSHTYVKQLIANGIPEAEAEVFASLKLDIVGHSNRMERHFAEVDLHFSDIGRRFTAVDGRFDLIDERFKSLDARFEMFQQSIDSRFAQSEAKMEAKFDEKLQALRADMIKWMFGFFVTQLAATFTMIRFMT
jgi:hypothetical protein